MTKGSGLMKVLQVCHRYYPYTGGIQEHVRNISKGLSKKYEVSIVTTDPLGRLQREEIVDGIRVTIFKSWAPRKTYYLSEDLKNYLAKNSNNFDIVHAHNYHALPALYAAQAKGRNKLVFTPHYHGTGHSFLDSLLHIPYKPLGKKIFAKANKIISVSSYEKNLIAKNFRVDEDKIVIIPNGINLQEFGGLEKRKKNYQSILCVGRLEKYKGMEYVIKVLPKLPDNVILEIVGKGSYKERLVSLARKLCIDNRVKFFQDLSRGRLLQKYADADVFVSLSTHEAYGISVAEALASRVPCIVANTSALMEWIDNKNSFGINYPINLDDFATLISNVIGKDVEAAKIPDWDEITEKLASLYEDLVKIM